MRFGLALAFILQFSFCHAQEIVNIVLVGDKGVTTDVNKTKYFIAIKNYGDTIFERLEYKMNGSLIRVISYKDSGLTLKNGRYLEYSPTGWISWEGKYVDGKKDGNWIFFGKNAKGKFEYKYKDDQIVETIDLDSSEKVNKSKQADPLDIEAKFKAGEKAYVKIVTDRITESINAGKLNKGGDVRVRFVVSTSGKMENFYLTRSSGFAFDEECLLIMRSITDEWIPASQHGRLVKAYREQPISFKLQ